MAHSGTRYVVVLKEDVVEHCGMWWLILKEDAVEHGGVWWLIRRNIAETV